MPIIGLSFMKMEAWRTNKHVEGELKINTTPRITNVKEIALPSLKEKALAMEFEFVTDYDPAIAKITINGNVMVIADNNKAVLDQWNKSKEMPEDVSIEVMNHVLRKCLLKAAQMADDLQLPPPLNMPLVVKAKDK